MGEGASNTIMSVFGETLKQARNQKGVTVKEAEQAIRVNRLHLAALEEENFSALPPLIYQRGIVRNYATYLALDPSKLLSMFDEARGGSGAPVNVVPSSPPVDMPKQWVPNFAVIAFMVVMGAVVFSWFYSAYFASGEPEPTATAVAPSVTPIPSDGPAGFESWSMVPTSEPKPTETATPESTPDESVETPDATEDERDGRVADALTAVAEPERDVEPTDEPVQVQEEQPEVFVQEEPEPEPEFVEESPVEETAPPAGDMIQLQFAPTSDITLRVVGDGVVLYDGFVTAGAVLGPFNAVGFEIYTSNVGATYITNLANGVEFQVAYDEGELYFPLP